MTDRIAAPDWVADLYGDRDRARDIAVYLEQENAALKANVQACGREASRYRREANVMHSVVEQAGLLQEALDGTGAGEMLRRILNGATFDEVRNG